MTDLADRIRAISCRPTSLGVEDGIVALVAEFEAQVEELRKLRAEDAAHREADAIKKTQARQERDEWQARYEAAKARVGELEHAARTRPDYDLRCQDCGAAHNVDTSIPSEAWNAICENRPGILPGAAGIDMPEVGVLCTLCIDARMVKAGITSDRAEFYFVGKALSSKRYGGEASDGELQERDRVVTALRRVHPLVKTIADSIVCGDSIWRPALEHIEAALGGPRVIRGHVFQRCAADAICLRRGFCHYVSAHDGFACDGLPEEHVA